MDLDKLTKAVRPEEDTMKLSELKAFYLNVLNEMTWAEKNSTEESWPAMRDAVAEKYGLGDSYSFVDRG
jgi:hypothetical protein